jgi:2-methylcitrate dehydratase PrpD
MPLALQIAERIHRLRYEDITPTALEWTRTAFIDTVGVTLAGMVEDGPQILMKVPGVATSPGPSLIFATDRRTSALDAALVNGTASHALDYDDVHLAYIGHTTVAVLPALLALAETREVTGAELMTAFVAGFETTCRVGSALQPGHYQMGFHATATAGSFGAAAGCARLLRLDADRTAMALGIAATQAAGLKSMFGTMCKPLHAGRTAENGLLAARLAARGFSSRPDAIECAQGFAATHGPDFHPEAALADPPGGFHIRANLFKYHAACFMTHAPIECARAVAAQPGFAADKVRSVRLTADRGTDLMCNIRAPRTALEAKFSLRFTVALALAGVDTAALGTYSEAATADPRLVALRDKVEVGFSDGGGRSAAAIAVTMADGSVLTAEHDAGVPAKDVAAQGRRIEAKFLSLAAPVVGAARAHSLREAVAGLDELRSVRALMALAG